MNHLWPVTKAADKAREWTENRNARIRAAVEAGESLRDVGQAAGLSHSAIAKIVKRS